MPTWQDPGQKDAARAGVRVRIYPQPWFLDGVRGPVPLTLDVAAGSVAPGPACDRMYAVCALGKTQPYGLLCDRSGRLVPFLPPWRGASLPPPRPDARGHFDWLEPDDPRFLAMHAWACARFALDLWQGWLGHVRWHFSSFSPRLEILCTDGLDNAQAGFGYIELGWNRGWRGHSHPFALNFDVIAHELGHLLLFSLLGIPPAAWQDAAFRAIHEAMADVVALLAAAALEPVVEDVLARTCGNLYLANELGRFAELSPADQLREASNSVSLAQFRDGWTDEHDLALPLVGAFFDILVEIYQIHLVEWGVIPSWVIELADDPERAAAFAHPLDEVFSDAFARSREPFRRALALARTLTGRIVAGTIRGLAGVRLSFASLVQAALQAERRVSNGRFARTLRDSFAWRGIGTIEVGPLLRPQPARSHLGSARTFVPLGMTRR
ncbi:hypothetical protein HRbin40_00940 [bacterium HR40]|nr:hypothetical protein HRbin40_00940 [bacterium HR40]